MFQIAILVGLYSYLVFIIGVFGFIYSSILVPVTFVFILLIFLSIKRLFTVSIKKINRFEFILILLLITSATVNLVGVLGPEISFDALWYHLTFPKIYLSSHIISHIPGGLLYYSDMPKQTEMIYTGLLSLGSDVFPKFAHLIFGLITTFAIYKVSLKFVPRNYALVASLIFYSNLVVGWESISANIDLARTFYEFLSLWAFINWYDYRNKKWLLMCGIMLGLAVSSKLLAIGSIGIFVSLLAYKFFLKKELMVFFKNLCILLIPATFLTAPWLIFSYLNTGNIFYPLFNNQIGININPPFSIFQAVQSLATTFVRSSDPISPIYLIMVPVLLLFFPKFKGAIRILYLYCVLALIIISLTPNIGGGRFFLAYLPAFSILIAYVLTLIKNKKLILFIFILIIFISISSIGYRTAANMKFLPVIIGTQSKSDFLSKNLNFTFGDFYDTDGYFKKSLKPDDKVLLYGFHNLYYINFSFIDSSWIKKGDKFNYIATQNTNLPKRFKDWRLIYSNNKTFVKLYSYNGEVWIY